jgi:hypothetical protein
LASELQGALVKNEQLAVAATAARAKSAQLMTPSVLGQRMEWLECLKQQGRPLHGTSSSASSDENSSSSSSSSKSTSSNGGGGGSASASGRSPRDGSSPQSSRMRACGEMLSLDLCRVE